MPIDYVTRSTVSQLEIYFEGVKVILVAEEKLCGFGKFYKKFKQKEWAAIRSLAQEELEERQNASDNIFNLTERRLGELLVFFTVRR